MKREHRAHWYGCRRFAGCFVAVHTQSKARRLFRPAELTNDPHAVTCKICRHHLIAQGVLEMPKRKISFKVSDADAALITIAAKRAVVLAKAQFMKLTQADTIMDLRACHANGCKLDLPKLLAFDDASFLHDVGGIRQHLDRNDNSRTGGQLLRNFLPRCHYAAPLKAPRK